jgi:hypothetical protein
MNSSRRDLMELASAMPEAALWTACIVLEAVRNTHDAIEAEEKEAARSPLPASNVVDIHAGRSPRGGGQRSPSARHTQIAQDQVSPAHHRIGEAIERIGHLRQHIKRAEARGQSTRLAEDLLSTFVRSLDLMQQHLDVMRPRAVPGALR